MPSSERRAVSFWLKDEPLILASSSAARRSVLEQAAIPFEICPASIDERAIEEGLLKSGRSPDAIAAKLAKEKALTVSKQRPGRLVLGADQLASCEGRLFAKPSGFEAAKRQLEFLSGRTHRLHSGVSIVCDGIVAFQTVECADLRMRPFSATFIEVYLATACDGVLASVGCYQLEALGAHLFESISGDHWTILGLPLLPVLEALRRQGALLA